MGEVRPFVPMWASPPGRTIQTRLDELGLDVSEFASASWDAVKVASRLLDGKETITIDIARRLSSVIGASAEFWVTRDCQYRDDLIRVETDRWLDDMPFREMTKSAGFLAIRLGITRRCRAFLFSGSRTWRVATKYEPMLAATRVRSSAAVPSKRSAVAAWLRKATCEAGAVTIAVNGTRLYCGTVSTRMKSVDMEQGPRQFHT